MIQTFGHAQNTQEDEWVEDIEFIKKELPDRHPNLFFHLPKGAFEARLDLLKADLDGLDDFAVVMRLREIIAEIGDPHTNFSFYDLIDGKGFYPIELYSFSDGLYVIGAAPAYKGILGTKLISINGTDIGTVVKRVSAVVPRNELYFAEKRLPYFVRFYGILRYYDIVAEKRTVFGFRTSAGELLEVQLEPVVVDNEDEYSSSVVRYEADSSPFYWLKYTTDEAYVRNAFRDRFFAEDGIYFVQYNMCWGKELEEQYGSPEDAENYPSFQEFMERVLATMENKSVNKVLFDMRFNGGGNSAQGTELVKRIAKIERINKKGALFVAISPETFSSAVINAMDFRQSTDALLIGRPTGGRPNHYGEVRGLELPNTKLNVYHSTKFFKYVDENSPAVMPDVVVESDFSQFDKGIDPMYEYVKKYGDATE